MHGKIAAEELINKLTDRAVASEIQVLILEFVVHLI